MDYNHSCVILNTTKSRGALNVKYPLLVSGTYSDTTGSFFKITMDVHLVVIAFMVCLFHFLAYVDGTKTLNIACLLPADDKRLFSISRVAPALEIVVNSELIKHQVLPFHKIGISYADSKCSISHGMNEAINVFVDGHVDVYFGPCCDYTAAPVARQLRYWNIPMVTAGAMARDFALSKLFQFPLMTRVGPNFNSLVSFIISILQKFNWSRVKLVYDPLGQAHVVDKFCHIATDGVHYGLRVQKVIKDFKQEYFKFDSIKDILNKMTVEVGNEFSSKLCCCYKGFQTLFTFAAVVIRAERNI